MIILYKQQIIVYNTINIQETTINGLFFLKITNNLLSQSSYKIDWIWEKDGDYFLSELIVVFIHR